MSGQDFQQVRTNMQRGGRTRKGRYNRAPETRTQNRERQREPMYLKEDYPQLEESHLSSCFTAQQLIFGYVSETEARLLHELSKKDVFCSSKPLQQAERFQKELSEKEEMLQKPQLETQELSEQCASLERKADQIQHFKKNKELRKKQREPLYLKEDNAQLGGSQLSSCFTAQQLISGDLSDFEARLLQELSTKDEICSSKLSQQAERFQKKNSEKEEMLQKPQLETQELSEQCASWRLKALQLEAKNQGLQYPREENTHLQTDLADSRQKFGDLLEEFNKKQSGTKERHLLDLSEKDEICRRELSQQAEGFQKELSGKEEMLQKRQLETQESSMQIANRRLTALQLEAKNQGLQHVGEENTQLQTDLADSRQKFGDLLEEFNKKQCYTKERHLLDLSEKDEICRRELSQQAEEFQKELSEKEEILQKHLSEKDETLLELQRLREENTQLWTDRADSRQKFGDLQMEFKETLAQINYQHKLDMWNRQQTYWADFSKQAERFQKDLSEKEEMLQKRQLETQESSMQIANWRLTALQLEAKNQGLRHLREENTQLQTDLADSRQTFGSMLEEFNKKQSDTKERHLLDLSEKDEICRRELSQQAEEFQKELSGKEEMLQKRQLETQESSMQIANWRLTALQLEAKNQGLQHVGEENTQLQTDLADSRQKFGDLLEEFNKKQSDTKERHLLDLSEKDEICRKELSQQAEEFQKEISGKEEIMQKHLSEKDETLLELQNLREKNTQLQELLMEKSKKEKKKNFFSRMFKLKKKIRDFFKPSFV